MGRRPLAQLGPTLAPWIINQALSTLAGNDYVDKSFEIMKIGAVDNLKALALELSLDATGTTSDTTKLVQQVDKPLGVFADTTQKQKWYSTGPVALRCASLRLRYLAPSSERTTCIAELDLRVGISHGEDLLKQVT